MSTRINTIVTFGYKYLSFIILIGVIFASGLIVASFTESSYASESDVYNKLVSLKSQFPDGKYYDHYVDQAGYDAFAAKDEQFQSTVTDHPCNHNANYVGNYDCNYFDGGSQCWGFASKLFYEVFGIRASQMAPMYDKNIVIGDWIRLNNGKYGEHSGIVLSVAGDSFTMAEANIDTVGKIGWGTKTYYKSSILYYKHASNYDSIKTDSPTSGLKATKIKTIFPKVQGFKLTWKKVQKCTGYQICYSTDPSFASSKTKTVKGKTKTRTSISKLSAKITYYVKVRTYKGTKHSKWSTVRRVTTKAIPYTKIYKPILKEYKRVFKGKKLNTRIMTKKQSGLDNCHCGLCTIRKGKLISYFNCNMNLRYVIKDINGDGTAELIVADVDSGVYTPYSIWTTNGKKPIYLAHSEYRHPYEIINNGYLREGMFGGAEYWAYKFYSINGTKLQRVAGVSHDSDAYYPNENFEGTSSRSEYDRILNQYDGSEMKFSWKKVK